MEKIMKEKSHRNYIERRDTQEKKKEEITREKQKKPSHTQTKQFTLKPATIAPN